MDSTFSPLPHQIESDIDRHQQTQAYLIILRTLSYAGVQLNALLFPLLVYELSSSISLAGLALLAEWLPKFAFYLVGGSLMQRFGYSRAHLTLEIGRFLALLGLLACANGGGSLWLLAACAALYQCSNAISNIIFETSVTRWWHVATRAHGHSLMLRADQIGCLLTLMAGIALKSPSVLLIAGLVVQGLVLVNTFFKRGMLYPRQAEPIPRAKLIRQLKSDIHAASKGQLPFFALSTVMMGAPIALLISALAYYLQRAQPGSASNAQMLSALLLARSALSLVVLQFVQKHLERGGSDNWIAWVGAAALALSSFALAAPDLSTLALAVCISMMGASASLYMPLLKNTRQAIVNANVSAESRSGVSGILLSVEAGAYLVAGALLWGFGSNLGLMAAVAGILATGGCLYLLFRHARAQPGSGQDIPGLAK
ncbi:MAG: hypothetical protein EPN79_11320 [Burkholderiaceae bacterium]|nr:MAG: hypothetical protein EPN79_11320 [Burkholderiaceae bacterium]TBR76726.1 MAG: hypothetical protein EPN64_05750 [Burkholderiaceae bacterium]